MWRHELSSESHGFTLVELLLALALVSLLTMALTSFVLAWQRQTYADYLRASLQDDLQYTQEILTFHLRRAYDIETSGSTFEITVAEGNKSLVIMLAKRPSGCTGRVIPFAPISSSWRSISARSRWCVCESQRVARYLALSKACP